ncbi:hypothetical protein [Pontiella agarivorans]|uniref:DUF3857 domain-containing protein n=1 Tax=Pontiella agarivorans TaxID=3038953 RepID=A0ABU5MZ34_9BACT|nr:hypothetical protein [Pontiella agarivorans]MDZ8119457.1 hypothetical protein [Pontiella agarivorans]
MKRILGCFLIGSSAVFAQLDSMEPRTFTNNAGKTLTDRIAKYDFLTQEVLLEKSGKVPLETFSAADQAYVLHWNQVEGFSSLLRFKMKLKKETWANLKHEQNITPYYMDAIQIPGKRTPTHNVIILEDYEEYNAVYLQAEGYEITLRNQNLFPIENITVESKIFYEQEQYIIPDSLFSSAENDYFDTVLTNKFRYCSETIPIMVTREEVILNSEAAVIVDHQIERSLLNPSKKGGDTESTDGISTDIEGFGEWDDHGRRRKGRVLGAWFRVGIEGLDGKMVWRDIASPSSLIDKWESFETAGLPEQTSADDEEDTDDSL